MKAETRSPILAALACGLLTAMASEFVAAQTAQPAADGTDVSGAFGRRLAVVQEEIELLTSASEEARTAALRSLKDAGPDLLPFLVAARDERTADRVPQAALDLIYQLKVEIAQEGPERDLLRHLEKVFVDPAAEEKTFEARIEELREATGLNIACDPGLRETLPVALPLDGKGTLRDCLDRLALAYRLDYDARYGVLWLAPSVRMWRSAPETPGPIPPDALGRIDETVDRLAGDDWEDRQRATDELQALGPGVVPHLQKRFFEQEPDVRLILADIMETLERRWQTKDAKVRLSPVPVRFDFELGAAADSETPTFVDMDGAAMQGGMGMPLPPGPQPKVGPPAKQKLSEHLKTLFKMFEMLGQDLPKLDLRADVDDPKKSPIVAKELKSITMRSYLELHLLPRGVQVTLKEGLLIIADAP